MIHQPKRILVIEDEVALSMSLKDNLSQEGFDVTVAEDGEKGLALALSLKPDLILLNLLLPEMDGMTVLRKIREEIFWGRAVPVIILTNLSSHDEKRMKDITKLEPAYYFEKTDWKIENVIQKVKEVLTENKK